MKKKIKIIFEIIYIFGTLGIVIFLTVSDKNFSIFLERIDEFNIWWIIVGLLSIIIYWIFQAIILQYIGKFADVHLSFSKNMKLAMIGEYYSAITPFATGGQPVQMAYYKRYNVNISRSSAILAIRYVGFQLALCIYCVIMMIFNGQYYYNQHNAIFWLTLLGFAINATSLVGIMIVVINKKLVERFGLFVIKKLSKLKRLAKKTHIWREKFLNGVEEFSHAAIYIKKNKGKAVIAAIISIIGVFFYFSIAYYVYLATGGKTATLVEITSLQVFLYLAVSFVPTPGALGASEGGFYLFFASIFTESFIFIAMLLWRFLTYYTNLLVGGAVVVIDEASRMVKQRKENRDDKEEKQL